MNGLNRTFQTRRETAPRQRSRFEHKNHVDIEEFDLKILPQDPLRSVGVLPVVWRFTPWSYVYLHLDREVLTYDAPMKGFSSYLLGCERLEVRQSSGRQLTYGIVTRGWGGFGE